MGDCCWSHRSLPCRIASSGSRHAGGYIPVVEMDLTVPFKGGFLRIGRFGYIETTKINLLDFIR